MKIDKRYKVEKVIGNDSTRDVLCNPYLSTRDGKGVMVATDGVRLACVPVERDEQDKDGHVSVRALNEARRQAGRTGTPEVICTEDTLTLLDGSTIPRKDQGKYPKWEQVVPAVDGNWQKLTLDAKLLHELANAIGSSKVALTFKCEGSQVLNPILVETGIESADGRKPFGLLMPTRV